MHSHGGGGGGGGGMGLPFTVMSREHRSEMVHTHAKIVFVPAVDVGSMPFHLVGSTPSRPRSIAAAVGCSGSPAGSMVTMSALTPQTCPAG